MFPRQRRSDVTTELSVGEGEEEEEEEEAGLRDQLDMHSIIVPFLNQEPLFTAEQVSIPAVLPRSLATTSASLSTSLRLGSAHGSFSSRLIHFITCDALSVYLCVSLFICFVRV